VERARFIDHNGVRIFYIDFSGCSIEEANEVIEASAGHIRSEPEGTVLTLTYTDGGKFNSELIGVLKEFTKGNIPYVKAAAVVGISGLQKIVLDAVSLFSSREFSTFESLDEAKDYLAGYAG